MVKKILIITTTIAIIGYGLIMIFGTNAISWISYNRSAFGVLYYRYDFGQYIHNLNESINNTAVLELTLPEKEMIALEGIDWYEDLAWDLKVIVDYIIFGLNVLLYPLRIGGYLLKNILSLIGIKTEGMQTREENPLYWVVNLVNWLAETQIPYTPN